MPSPSPLPIDIDLRQKEIDLQAQERGTPFRNILQGGVESAGTFQKIQDDRENRQKAKAFEEVLQGGQKSLLAFIDEAKKEGKDVTGLKELADTARDPKTLESAWGVTIKKIDRQTLGETLETDGSEAGAIFATKKGLGETSSQKGIEFVQEEEILGELETLFQGEDPKSEGDVEEYTGKKLDDSAYLAKKKKELQAQRRKFSNAKRSARPEVKAKLTAIDKEISDIETMEKERRLSIQFMTRENNKKMDQTVRDLENETRTGLGVQFVDAAIPGGIFQAPDKIAGVGGGSKLWRKWLKTPEAIKINMAVKNYLGAVRKRDAGVAVTEREAKFLEEQFGLNLRGTVADFIEAFKIKSTEAKANLTKAWARFQTHQLPELKRLYPDLIFPQDIPGPGGKRGGNIAPEDLSQKKPENKPVSTAPTDEEIDNMTLEQANAYNAGKPWKDVTKD